MDDDGFVTHAQCAATIKRVSGEIKRQGKALYGDDGRGGIQHDMTVTKETVVRIEEALNGKEEVMLRHKEISVKRLMVYVTIVCAVVTAVIGPLVTVIVQRLLGGI